jgi:hypothetical protein
MGRRVSLRSGGYLRPPQAKCEARQPNAMTSSQGRLPAIALAMLGSAVVIAGCGSGGPTKGSSLTVQGKSSTALTFANCMRSNGISNFPDLGSSGIRIEASGQTLSVNGVSVNAPAFAAARTKCEKYLPHVQVSQAQITQGTRKGLQFARCMRSHGVPNFPDPKVTRGTNGNRVVDLRGAGLNFDAPAFKAAASACGGGPKGPF